MLDPVLFDGTNQATKQVVLIEYTTSKPFLVKYAIHAQFGVLIGITGDFRGKLVLASDTFTFEAIKEKMFGIEVSDEMLVSFSGELGNMLAGNISTNIVKEGLAVDIISPSIIEGRAKVFVFMLAIQVSVHFSGLGNFYIYVMID